MRRPTTLYSALFVVATTLLVGWLSFRVLKPFWSAAAWAIVLAVAFWTPWQALKRRLVKRRSLAALLMTTAIALVVLLPAAGFVGLLAAQASNLATTVTQTLKDRHITSPSDLIQLPWIAGALDRAQSLLHISPEEFQTKVDALLTGASSEIASLSGQLVLSVFDAVLTFFTTLFLLFFCFRDGDRWTTAVLELLPTTAERRSAQAKRLGDMLNEIFRGSLFCALIQGAVGGAGWAIVGLPSPALAGAAMAILSLLPIGGTAIVWLPGSLWLWSRDRTGAAIVLFLWGAILASFLADNVLKPMLIRGEELNTLVVFLGVFGGLTAFGLLGIFIGPIALAFAVTMLEVLRHEARGDDVPAPPEAPAGETAGA
ncbi:MAG: AI-2E family transporter [Acidobacteriota bacterium]